MTNPFELLLAPPEGQAVGGAWFTDIAELLLNRTAFMVGGKAHRLCEIEFYYNAEEHEDPFAHGEEAQRGSGDWYFHSDNGEYRGGSFKGLDIAFGREGAFGGILIRTIESEDGTFVNGCSLCVDHMLATTDKAKVAALDAAVDKRKVWDTSSPLHLAPIDNPRREVWSTARVGLSLKRARRFETMPEYIMRPYRFLTDANRVKKGRVHHVIAMHKAGHEPAEIHRITRSPKHIIARYVEAYEAGREQDSTRRFVGRSMKTNDLCNLHGTWERLYGAS